MALDFEEIEAIAECIAELVLSAPPATGLVDARDLAEQLGVARDWVYANADRLGGVRLGNGPRARLRFDVEQAREALAAGAEDDQSRREDPPRRQRGRPLAAEMLVELLAAICERDAVADPLLRVATLERAASCAKP